MDMTPSKQLAVEGTDMTQRILVVDDDPSIVKIMRGYLEQAEYDVLTASDGDRALQLVRQERPDLVVLDVMLPQHDGWEITRRIRADAALAATPIILLTARVEDTDKIIGLELGADDYITKPFNAREVVARVRALLRRTDLDQGRRGLARVLVAGARAGRWRRAPRPGSLHGDGRRNTGRADAYRVQTVAAVDGTSRLYVDPR